MMYLYIVARHAATRAASVGSFGDQGIEIVVDKDTGQIFTVWRRGDKT